MMFPLWGDRKAFDHDLMTIKGFRRFAIYNWVTRYDGLSEILIHEC